MLLPVVYLKSRKFSLLFSLGSLFVLGALAMLRGPAAFVAHLMGRDRWPLSLLYLTSVFATLYCAMGLRRSLPTLFTAACQVCGNGVHLWIFQAPSQTQPTF